MRREFVLLGNPIGHSVSPRIHRAAFRVWGVDAAYEALEVEDALVAAAVERAATVGGGNVTLPYKTRVARLVDEPTAEVRATGACNCFWGTPEGAIAGDNTDVGGFIRAVREVGVDLAGERVLLLGAGGAARAVIRALERMGIGSVDVWNRTTSTARALAGERPGLVDALPDLRAAGDYALAVNATSLGLRADDRVPLDPASGVARAIFDLAYAPGGTAWVRRAAEVGVPARDGLGMLVYQAALSLERWFPDRAPPLEAMFAAARGSVS